MPSRRALLRSSCAAGTVALAGCARLPLVPGPQLSIRFRNEIDREADVAVELIRPNGREYSEAIAYEASVTVPAPAPRTGAPGRLELGDVAPARGYQVRVWFGDAFGDPAVDYRYYPDCGARPVTGGDEPAPEIYVELSRDDEGNATASVAQTRCSDDSVWY